MSRRGAASLPGLFLLYLVTGSSLATGAAFNFSAGSMITKIDDNDSSRVVILKGVARVTSDDYNISADQITLSGRNYALVSCEGDVVVIDKKNDRTIKSAVLKYRRATNYLQASGSVEVSDIKQGIVTRSGYFETAGDNTPLRFESAVRIIKNNVFSRADSAEFNGNSKILRLVGNAFVIRDSGRFRADAISVNTDTMELKMEGAITGRVKENADGGDFSLDDDTDLSMNQGGPP